MINLKNILKVLLIALFVCAWSGDVRAQKSDLVKGLEARDEAIGNALKNGEPIAKAMQKGDDIMYETGRNMVKNSTSGDDKAAGTDKVTVTGGGGVNDASFCSGDLGIFKELVQTGQMIFNRLRDLIYVVAGFGIIAVAVGGFFGNLNWKWLGAIVISLVVIATAGELIVLMTGCESFNGSLITNTLTSPTPTMTTDEYNDAYTVETTSAGKISWDDTRDVSDYYGSTFSNSIVPDDEGSGNSEAGKENDAFQ